MVPASKLLNPSVAQFVFVVFDHAQSGHTLISSDSTVRVELRVDKAIGIPLEMLNVSLMSVL